MHDALARYEADTEVVDTDDWRTEPIARGRVRTEDLIVHVRTLDDGMWHRLHPSTIKTACGVPVNLHRSETRTGRHADHPLAECECWTTEERREANDEYRKQFGRDYTPGK